MFYYPLSPRALRSAETACALYYERRRSSPSIFHGDVPIFERFGFSSRFTNTTVRTGEGAMSQWIALTGMALVYIALLAASAWRARLIGDARTRVRLVPTQAYLQSRRIRRSVAEGDLCLRPAWPDPEERHSADAAPRAATANQPSSGRAKGRASDSTRTFARPAEPIQPTE